MTLHIEERNENILKLRTTIKKAASSVAYNWPGVIEADDAEQAITLKLLESHSSIEKIIDMEPAAQYRAVVGIGHQIASQARADYDHFKGSYRYSLKEVKDALAAGALVEEFDHFHEVVFDLMQALEVLTKRTPQYADAILDRYADFNIPEKGAPQVRLSRALEALVNEMNKSNKRQWATRDDGVGTRKVIPNSTAYYVTQYEETGDYPLSHNENRAQRQI